MDERLRRLEREAELGGSQERVALARAYERVGRDLEAYLLYRWIGEDCQEVGARIRAAQQKTLKEMGGWAQRPLVNVACERDPKQGIYAWRWLPVADVLKRKNSKTPVLAVKAFPSMSRTRLERVLRLGPLIALDLAYGHKLGDRALRLLPQVSGLRQLWLSAMCVGDAGLQHVGGCRTLRFLSIRPQLRSEDSVSDDGLQGLSRLSELRVLDLSGCEHLTDEGLRHLEALGSLEQLQVRVEDQLTGAGLARLQTSLPRLGVRLPIRGPGPTRIGWEQASVLEACHLFGLEHRSEEVREVARRSGQAVLAALEQDGLASANAAVPLLTLPLAWPEAGWELSGKAVGALEVFAQRGVDMTPALGQLLAEGLTDSNRASFAFRTLRSFAVQGGDLEVLRPGLLEAAKINPEAQTLLSLMAARTRTDSQVLSSFDVVSRRWGHERKPATQLVDWAMAYGDSKLQSQVADAVRAAEGKRLPPQLGRVVERALVDGPYWVRASASIVARLLVWDGGTPSLDAIIALLGRALVGEDAEVAQAAGDALWTCARRGHDLTAVLDTLAGIKGRGPLTWDPAGASPRLERYLERRKVKETLPRLCRHRRHHGQTDQASDTIHGAIPRPCPVCFSPDTTCVYYDVSHGWETAYLTWEYRCGRCGKYAQYDAMED